MATSAESMAALMAEARAEQSLISAQLKALRGEVPEAAPSPRGGNTSPSHAADLAASFAESRPAGSSPLSSPSAWASPRAAAPSRGAGLPGVDEVVGGGTEDR
ncbi:hypothetical protein AK812_SmicGene12432 [Symbiodinium microadriaticum]|uniref:Uncharacterized protein n=1 Tax=Symbiodinium microadriaticum TaxID=2951 RepID=A0A1Q9EAR7_SYMMI|nr:hypothetical protein AK812_SmicGene12432 [Symbiodinium microadriaticum]